MRIEDRRQNCCGKYISRYCLAQQTSLTVCRLVWLHFPTPCPVAPKCVEVAVLWKKLGQKVKHVGHDGAKRVVSSLGVSVNDFPATYDVKEQPSIYLAKEKHALAAAP